MLSKFVFYPKFHANITHICLKPVFLYSFLNITRRHSYLMRIHLYDYTKIFQLAYIEYDYLTQKSFILLSIRHGKYKASASSQLA